MYRSIFCLLSILLLASPAAAVDQPERANRPIPTPSGVESRLTSSTNGPLAARETAGPDTFVLYGGPDHATEGKFQLADGITPDWGDGSGLPRGYGGGPEAWRPVDFTKAPTAWHVDAFNAANLNGHGPGNRAMWCGLAADDLAAGNWVHAPGYGNGWDVSLLYESASIADLSAGQTVSLDFFFNYDTEENYDFFRVEYDRAGVWTPVLEVSGSNKDVSDQFAAPGVQFTTEQTAPIEYLGNDYGGLSGDQIRIRLRFETDLGWSDEDGAHLTTAGAVQVDDISLSHSGGASFEDFEGVGPFDWRWVQPIFAGDFADLYAGLTDIDPCRGNPTPVVGFMDRGQIIRNGPGIDGSTHVPGGTTRPGIEYGVPGYYTINNRGGLSFGLTGIRSEVWSPEILWDLPGTDDDDVGIAGATLSYSAWMDLKAKDGMFHVWFVRSARAGEVYSAWQHDNLAWNSEQPEWQNLTRSLTHLLVVNPERIQVRLAVWDFGALFGVVTAPTPAPWFDNVTLRKYQLDGPVITADERHLAQDGFPISGSIDASTPAARDALDIPFNMARDVNSGDVVNVAGDSVVADVEALIPGTDVADIRMFWALKTNSLFEDAIRTAPARAKDQNVIAGPAGSIWTGEVLGEPCVTSYGATVADRYFFDLPDVDFIYPGDVLHYYIQATDSGGRIATLPAETSDFLRFDLGGPGQIDTWFDRRFTVRGLPSIQGSDGSQPQILLWNDYGPRNDYGPSEEEEWIRAVGEKSLEEGIALDIYTSRAPWSRESNGLGSAGVHGANAGQLAGYQIIVYSSGSRGAGTLSDGSSSGFNDKSNDIGVLEQWHANGTSPYDRNSVYFGDSVVSDLATGSVAGAAYVSAVMGIDYAGVDDVRDAVGGQVAPFVVPDASGPYAGVFGTQFVARGGCPTISRFDQIQPGPSATAGHLFAGRDGVPYPAGSDPAISGVASVIHPHAHGTVVTFPYSFEDVSFEQARSVGFAARALLLEEVLSLSTVLIGWPPVVEAPAALVVDLSASPNPFNPTTLVKFTAVAGSKGSVKVFNLRGELVQTLHNGEFTKQEFRWEGTDQRGATVASGVYLIKATDGSVTKTEKVALVK